MVDDGGLEALLQTSDRVWNELCFLHEKKLAAAGSEAESSASASAVATGATKSRATMMRTRDSLFGGGGGSRILDLSQHSESELKNAIAPLITEMEKIDAAALLSLDPIKEDSTSNTKNAILDPNRGLTVKPIHDRVFPPCDDHDAGDDDDDMGGTSYLDDDNKSEINNNTVRYLHVVDIPHKYSLGIFVFPPNARMPLHDHPNMIVTSRVLYGELQVQSYDIVHPVGPTSNNTDADADMVDEDTDYDMDAPISDNVHHRNLADETTSAANATTFSNSPTKTTGVLHKSLTKIRDFLSMKMVSYSSHGYDNDVDNSMYVDQVLHVRPNLNPVGTVRRRSSSSVPVSTNDGSGSSTTTKTLTSSVKVSNVGDDTGANCNDNDDEDQVVISAPNVTCLFPREGNCHAFVAGPHGAALLDVLLPPYDTEEVRDCTFYEVANVHHPIQSSVSTASLKLTPIDQPEDFHCVSGSYGRFGACTNY